MKLSQTQADMLYLATMITVPCALVVAGGYVGAEDVLGFFGPCPVAFEQRLQGGIVGTILGAGLGIAFVLEYDVIRAGLSRRSPSAQSSGHTSQPSCIR